MEANCEKFRFNLHSLKGVVANFSATIVFEKVKELEKTAANLCEAGGNGFNKEELLANLSIIKEMVYQVMDDLKSIKEDYV